MTPARVGSGCDLLQKLQPLATQTEVELHEASRIASRLREALDKARANGIDDGYEHNRHASGRLQEWSGGGGAT